MAQDDMPGALGSNAGLGPLPEPYKKVRIVEDADYPIDIHLYSPKQMRDYAAVAVAVERERNIEAVMWELDSNGQAHAIALKIRGA